MLADVEFRTKRAMDTAALDNKRGTRRITVTVERVNDIVGRRQGYVVTCSARLRIEGNPTEVNSTITTSYAGYPALIQSGMTMSGFDPAAVACELNHYAPKTLNSSTQSTRSGGTSQGKAIERQHTVGSSQSTTNSFGANVQLGMQGEVPTGDMGANFQYSSTSEQSVSDLSGLTQNVGEDASASTTVNIMDWAAIATVTELDQSIEWWWGQEYPWNVIRYHDKVASLDDNISLPDHIIRILHEDGVLLPPSELAMFGTDFTTKARWLVTANSGLPFDSPLSLSSDPTVYLGTHTLSGEGEKATVNATLKKTTTAFSPNPCKIESLAKLALVPLAMGTTFTGAINFRVSPAFASPLGPAEGMRAFVSVSNELMAVASAEFGPDMSVKLDAKTSATLKLFFKVDDRNSHVNLTLRCWKDGASNVSVRMLIHPDRDKLLPTETVTLTRHVDWKKADGSNNALLAVDLRNRDYFSDDCCDFLETGTNVVELQFTSTGDPVTLHLPTIAVG